MEIIVPIFRIVDISDGEREAPNQRWECQLDDCVISYIGVFTLSFFLSFTVS